MSTYIFGDSFVGPFTLLEENENLSVHKFNKTTLKGLTNKDNVIRKLIEDTVDMEHSLINNAIFNFGYIDLHFNHYKMTINDVTHNIKKNIKNYVQFIDSLNLPNHKKYILAIYPSTISDENMFDSLKLYKVLNDDDVNSLSNDTRKELSSHKYRYNLYKKFNDILKFYCKQYGIKFICIDKYLLDDENRLKKEFKNPLSELNIHILWEPLIPILLQALKFIRSDYKVNLNVSSKNFINFKLSKQFNSIDI